MKNMCKRKFIKDPLAEIKKDPHFLVYSEEESMKIRLGVEIYNARKLTGISQEDLAKKVFTTQRVISNIENADVNVGTNLFGRIARLLNLNSDMLARIFGSPMAYKLISFKGEGSHNQESEFNNKQVQYNTLTSTTGLRN